MSKWKNWVKTKNGGLSYQNYKAYRDCPQKYKWRVEKKVVTDPGDPLNLFLGCVWAHVMEDFYASDILQQASAVFQESGDKKKSGAVVDKYLKERALHWFDTEDIRLGIVWKSKELRKEQWETLLYQLKLFRNCVKADKLLGNRNYPEREYGHVLRDFYLNGFADLVFEKDSVKLVADVGEEGEEVKREEVTTKLTIIDGKTTKDPRYLDPDQLYGYSYLNYLKYGKFADYLGFLLFRKGTVRWIEASDKKMNEYLQRLEEVMDGIEAKNFTATPSNNSCRFCDWRSGCSEYAEFMKTSAEARLLKQKETFDPFEDSFGGDLVEV